MKIVDTYANFLLWIVNPFFWLSMFFGLFLVLLGTITFPLWGWLLVSSKYRKGFISLFKDRSTNEDGIGGN